jgi:hypothetical protein
MNNLNKRKQINLKLTKRRNTFKSNNFKKRSQSLLNRIKNLQFNNLI